MADPIRVLQVYPQMNNAGTEKVIFNLYNHIDRSKIQFDFLVDRPGELDYMILELGGTIHTIHETNNRQYENRLYSFFKDHPEYRIVHTHTDDRMGIVLKAAKKADVVCRIAHSHNYRGDVPRIAKYYKMISSWNIERYANCFLACSNEAAEWLFPRRYKKADVWNNAIELDKYLYDKGERNKRREEFGIPKQAKVICHVGRFAEQKNHRRILELVNAIVAKQSDVYVLLVGVGPLENEMKSIAVSDRILFLGNRHDVPMLLNVGDVFLFPSLYEGLGIVAVEAQASGMLCIASTNVPKAADIGTGKFIQISLRESNDNWIKAIMNELNGDHSNRRVFSEMSLRTSYNIETIAKKAQEFYLDV
ncbi:MAG: glycosyltransferase [Clostridia bacterium]|nr:glycosyltransferase [Clostridia bacterium]